jgi:hypothetical protein
LPVVPPAPPPPVVPPAPVAPPAPAPVEPPGPDVPPAPPAPVPGVAGDDEQAHAQTQSSETSACVRTKKPAETKRATG